MLPVHHLPPPWAQDPPIPPLTFRQAMCRIEWLSALTGGSLTQVLNYQGES